jgi:hypothetical protein
MDQKGLPGIIEGDSAFFVPSIVVQKNEQNT